MEAIQNARLMILYIVRIRVLRPRFAVSFCFPIVSTA